MSFEHESYIWMQMSFAWNVKVTLDHFGRRCRPKRGSSQCHMSAQFELEICATYFGYWEAYKKTLEVVIASAQVAIVKAQVLIQDNEHKLANEKKKVEELETAKSRCSRNSLFTLPSWNPFKAACCEEAPIGRGVEGPSFGWGWEGSTKRYSTPQGPNKIARWARMTSCHFSLSVTFYLMNKRMFVSLLWFWYE